MNTRKNKSSKKKNVTFKTHYGECIDATFHGLQCWFKSLFEKLGWMILAKNRGMTDKISVYKHSIERLKCTLEKKIKNTKDHDKKEDLMIMHENLMILWEHANKDL